MSKFLYVRDLRGEPTLVNLDDISLIEPNTDKDCTIYFMHTESTAPGLTVQRNFKEIGQALEKEKLVIVPEVKR